MALNKVGAYSSGATYRTPLYVLNSRLGWKCITVTDAISYNGALLITIVKIFIRAAPNAFSFYFDGNGENETKRLIRRKSV
jgi:hypothetical protein